MKAKIYLLFFLCLCGGIAWGQTRQITGQVTKAGTSEPVPGVTVTLKGSKKGTATNADGKFTISVPATGTVNLVFSSVGFTSQEVNVGSNGSADVSLVEAAASTLNDVVVIGYQSIKRKNLTASVSSISARDLKDIPINSAAEALNGRLAGVTATTAEGSPDATIRIRVRGGMSITGDNSPLFIVDGVQVENALSTLAVQDIQSIDVLKDAAATAIYGARGGNGVIVITTKSGKPGKLVVTYNGFVGVKFLRKSLDGLDPYDYVIYQSERSRGSSTDSTSFLKNFGSTWDTLAFYKNANPVNWQDEVFGRTGVMTTHNITASGGTQKLTYNFGYTYSNDKAIVINSNFQRHLLNLKGDYKFTKNIKLGVSGRYQNQDVLGAGVSSDQGSSYNRLRNAVKYRPFLSPNEQIDDNDPIADPNVGNGLNLVNPIKLANAEYRKKSTESFNFSANASITIIKNLSFKSTFGYDHKNTIDRQFSDSVTPYSIIQGGKKPIAQLDSTTAKTLTNSNVLTYSVKGFKGKHDFDFLVGEETYDLKTETHTSLVKSFPNGTSHDAAFGNLGLGTSFTGYPRVYKSRYTNLSFFGRINYSFMDKYLFSANVREDGASKFKPGRQWGTFPSMSVAWRAKNEKFLQDVNFLNDLKFRFGFGTIGNNRIDDYLYLSTFSSNGRYYYGLNNTAIIGYYQTSLPNELLQWESTVNRNYGLDFTIFNNRVDVSFDIYNNSSSKLLLNVPISGTFGYASQLQNIGKTSNKGVELQLNALVLKKNQFTWNANFNFSTNKSRVVQLGVNQPFIQPAASWGVSGQPADYITRIGDPVGAMWGWVNDGFYKVSDFDYNTSTGAYRLKPGVVNDSALIGPVGPGSIKFKDLNGDGIVDVDHDRQIIGDPTAKFTGGLNQSFTYKQWDLSVFVNYCIGNDIYNANKIEFTNGYTNNSNMLALMAGRWKVVTATGQTAQWVNGLIVYGIPPDQLTALNANATIWQPLKGAGAFFPSSWAIEDGSFLRINNVSVGYSLPVKSLIKMGINKLRFYVTGNNLAVITNYSGYDPEVSVRNDPRTPGLDYSAYPKSRSFIFGVNATF